MDQKETPPASVREGLTGLEAIFDDIFVKKAPFQLPTSVKDFIVTVMPWIELVLLIVMLPAILVVLGLGTLSWGIMAAASITTGPIYYAGIVVLAIELVMMAIAIPGLIARKKSAWNLAFYSSLLSIGYSILSGGVSGIISAIISAIVSLYFLFQIRSYYK